MPNWSTQFAGLSAIAVRLDFGITSAGNYHSCAQEEQTKTSGGSLLCDFVGSAVFVIVSRGLVGYTAPFLGNPFDQYIRLLESSNKC